MTHIKRINGIGLDYFPGDTLVFAGLTYGVVLAKDGRLWLDRNLGATQVATAYNDAAAYGDLYQWGRYCDRHQVRTSPTSATRIAYTTTGNGNFITCVDSPYDWADPQSDLPWQGLNGPNNPGPVGFRLPTQAEWAALVAAENITNIATGYSSSLKLTYAQQRNSETAAIQDVGRYWSSTVDGIYSHGLNFDDGIVSTAAMYSRALGLAVRPIKDY